MIWFFLVLLLYWCSTCCFFNSFMCLFFFFHVLDNESVLFVRRFWTSFFEQVVFALGVLSVPSASDVSPVVRGIFASSTKYLRQSSWPYYCSVLHAVTFTIRYLSFFNKIFQDVHSDHSACCLSCRILFPSFAKVSLCRKEIEDSRGVLYKQQLVHDLFFITRATIRETVLQHLEITYLLLPQ